MSRTVALDFESFYSRKLKYSLRGMIAEEYCNHELFDPYLLAVYDGAESWVGHPKDFNWDALSGTICLAHNRYFDNSVWDALARKGVCPKPNFKEFHCTANMTAYLCGSRALDAALMKLKGVKVSKTARGNADNKRWPDDFSPDEQKAMLRYAGDDPKHCWNLWDSFNSQWPDVEKRLSNITIEQGMRGIQINERLLDEYICRSHEMRAATEETIPWIRDSEDESWDEFNDKPTSTKCLAEQCRREGIPCSPVKTHEPEAFEAWVETHSPGRPWIKAMTAWRSVNKLYQTFVIMKRRLRPDGTLPFSLLYFGAHTGRWTATAKINLQNQRRKPIFCNEHGLMETDDVRTDAAMRAKGESGKWPEWVRHTLDFRHLIMPRPGKKMIVSDLSQIEPRVLAWLSGDTELLKMLSGGMSLYEAYARSKLKWTGGNLKDEDPTFYSYAKANVLALGYGAGWEKYTGMALSLAGYDVAKDDPEFVEVRNEAGELVQVSGKGTTAKAHVKAFREGNPAIAGDGGIWKKLESGLRRSVGSDFEVTLPNGRVMRYEKVRCERRIEPDPLTKRPRSRAVYTAMVGRKRTHLYGGKLTENVTQATARDVFSEHIVKLEDMLGVTNLFSVHDEAVLEVDSNVTVDDIENVMSFCPEWLKGCPVEAKASEVDHYQK